MTRYAGRLYLFCHVLVNSSLVLCVVVLESHLLGISETRIYTDEQRVNGDVAYAAGSRTDGVGDAAARRGLVIFGTKTGALAASMEMRDGAVSEADSGSGGAPSSV